MLLRTLSIPELFYLLSFCSAEAMEEVEVKEMLLGVPPRATFWHWEKNHGVPTGQATRDQAGFPTTQKGSLLAGITLCHSAAS